jgi:hypothetical protein
MEVANRIKSINHRKGVESNQSRIERASLVVKTGPTRRIRASQVQRIKSNRLRQVQRIESNESSVAKGSTMVLSEELHCRRIDSPYKSYGKMFNVWSSANLVKARLQSTVPLLTGKNGADRTANDVGRALMNFTSEFNGVTVPSRDRLSSALARARDGCVGCLFVACNGDSRGC